MPGMTVLAALSLVAATVAVMLNREPQLANDQVSDWFSDQLG
jgi:hypothetical protein